jgi:CO/xanthine dehydrogenase Mo-binding subunit
MSLVAPYTVVNDPKLHDPMAAMIVTGRLDFPDDRLAGKKLWAAVKTSTNAHGSILADAGTITAITVGNGGSGYTSAPTVTITGGGGTGASATATVSAAGAVTAIALNSAGSGYTSAPTITLTGGAGAGATATVAFTAGKLHIDTTAALAFPGVVGVFHAGSFPAGSSAAGGFATSWTNYGVVIAAVVATDWETARWACNLITVTYNAPLPVVFDADAAMSASSPLSGRQATSNVTTSTQTRLDAAGNGAAYGLAHCDKTMQVTTTWTPTQQHNPIHPKTGLAYFTGDPGDQTRQGTGDCYGFSVTQNAMSHLNSLYSSVNMPQQQTHYQAHGCGGGFGDGESTVQMSMAAVLSQALGGAIVVLKLSRKDHNHIGGRQYDTKGVFNIGYNKDGTIVAWQGGWYGNGGGASGMWYGLRTTYKIPYLDWTAYNIYTNTPARNSWRDVADPEGGWAFERAIDLIAADLGMDPYAVRQKNLMGVLDPDQDGTKLVWSDKCVNDCLAQAYTASGYASKWHAPNTKTLADGRKHGIALAGRQDSHGGMSGGGRYGHLLMGGTHTNGSVEMYMGGSRASMGPQAAMMVVVAEVLGLPYSAVRLAEWANGDITLADGMQNGSSHTPGAGSAFYMAALDMRIRIFNRACGLAPLSTVVPAGVTQAKATAVLSTVFPGGTIASFTITNGGSGYTGVPAVTISGGGGTSASATAHVTNGVVDAIVVTNQGSGFTTVPTVVVSAVTPDLLDAANGSIFLKSDPTKTITHATCTNGWDPQISVAQGWGSYLRTAAVGSAPIGSACNSTGGAAACIEVAVDTNTGEVEILGYWNATSTGTTLFKPGVMKEISSGCEAGIGQCLFYGDVYDPTTAAVLQMSHGSFSQQTALDLYPSAFTLIDVQHNSPSGPLGCHGMAEPASGEPNVVWEAIYNAIGVFPDHNHGAGSPNTILKALGKAT